VCAVMVTVTEVGTHSIPVINPSGMFQHAGTPHSTCWSLLFDTVLPLMQ